MSERMYCDNCEGQITSAQYFTAKAKDFCTEACRFEFLHSMPKCDALTWSKDAIDFAECDSAETEPVVLVGLMLSVNAHLCEAHRKYVAKRAGEWANTDILHKGVSISRWSNLSRKQQTEQAKAGA